MSKIFKVYSSLEQKYERPPSAEEIAKELDMTVNQVKSTMKNSPKHLSMDAPLKDGESYNLYNITKSKETSKPDEEVMQESLSTDIDRVLNTLPDKEKNVVRLYFGIGEKNSLTLNEIGEIFDLTRERVRQIKEKGIRLLRRKSQNEVLRAYL